MKKIVFLFLTILLMLSVNSFASDYQIDIGNTVTAVTLNTPVVIDGSDDKMTYFKIWDDGLAYDITMWLGNSYTVTAIFIPAAMQPFEYNAYNDTLETTGVCISTTVTTNVYFYSTRNHDTD